MAKLTRQLHARAKGSWAENESWWHLVFDTESKRLYVEHEWDRVNLWRSERSDTGSKELEISTFLAEGDGPAQRELIRLIEGLFQEG